MPLYSNGEKNADVLNDGPLVAERVPSYGASLHEGSWAHGWLIVVSQVRAKARCVTQKTSQVQQIQNQVLSL